MNEHPVGTVELHHHFLQTLIEDAKVFLGARCDEDVVFLLMVLGFIFIISFFIIWEILAIREAIEDIHVDGLLKVLHLVYTAYVLVVGLLLVLFDFRLYVPHIDVPVYALAYHDEVVV